jgi:hypothetical protein
MLRKWAPEEVGKTGDFLKRKQTFLKRKVIFLK